MGRWLRPQQTLLVVLHLHLQLLVFAVTLTRPRLVLTNAITGHTTVILVCRSWPRPVVLLTSRLTSTTLEAIATWWTASLVISLPNITQTLSLTLEVHPTVSWRAPTTSELHLTVP
ncbi:hypothetical protein NP493_615g00006 [Ridgeia piscesae]|uniref:Secreted protein n=1 Tax=Ridgeia piscesae TaxID=27915 RepID=A0AAD9KTP5_RIDPI|nr:hypothetical protein NP493_615g00006 [Ridgeia piscesae]